MRQSRAIEREKHGVRSSIGAFRGVWRGERRATCRACTACGSAYAVFSTSVEAKEVPALPNELLLMIAKYFEPGTRNLLNLARVSRNVYRLLSPWLYQCIEMPDIFSAFEHAMGNAMRVEPSRVVPSGLLQVRKLSEPPGPGGLRST